MPETSCGMPACHTTRSEHFGGEKCLFFQTLRALDEGECQLVVEAEQRKNKGRCAEVNRGQVLLESCSTARGAAGNFEPCPLPKGP